MKKNGKAILSGLFVAMFATASACAVEVDDPLPPEEENIGEVEQAICSYGGQPGCAPGLNCCGGFFGSCVDLSSNNSHCGTCGNVCPTGAPFFWQCTARYCPDDPYPGACCPQGTVNCYGACQSSCTCIGE